MLSVYRHFSKYLICNVSIKSVVFQWSRSRVNEGFPLILISQIHLGACKTWSLERLSVVRNFPVQSPKLSCWWQAWSACKLLYSFDGKSIIDIAILTWSSKCTFFVFKSFESIPLDTHSIQILFIDKKKVINHLNVKNVGFFWKYTSPIQNLYLFHYW